MDVPGCEKTAEELEERRYPFAAKTFEGMLKLDGLHDPATGDLILTALEAAAAFPSQDEQRTAR